MTRKRPVRTPRQKRSIETAQRIVEAAEALFSEKGFHGTNSKEIAAAAGVSIGAFYDYFPNKKALFLEVSRQYSARVMDRVFGTLAADRPHPEDPRSFVHAMIRMALEAHDLSPQFHREAMVMRLSDPDVKDLLDAEEEMILARLREILRAMEGATRIQDVEAAAVVMKSALEEVIHGIKIFTPRVEKERLLSELADMISRYLFEAA